MAGKSKDRTRDYNQTAEEVERPEQYSQRKMNKNKKITNQTTTTVRDGE